jgi:hypothetical protein
VLSVRSDKCNVAAASFIFNELRARGQLNTSITAFNTAFMRIPTLLQKISELAAHPERRTAIDVDLMLDYTRVLYADLMEWRARLPAVNSSAPTKAAPPAPEPTLEELAKSQAREETAVKEEKPPVAEQRSTGGATIPIPQPSTASGNERDIRSMIGINDKYQIMSELFGNDKEAYEQALDFINRSQSENMAMQWLREQLWITEERSDAALGFFEIVGRYFRR